MGEEYHSQGAMHDRARTWALLERIATALEAISAMLAAKALLDQLEKEVDDASRG